MKFISVSGTGSDAGKTTIATFLIKALGVTSALKITVHHGGFCPKETICDGCSTAEDVPFKVTTDPALLGEGGKDTARFLKAGASKVVWLQSYPESLKEGIDNALSHFEKEAKVVVEGNSFLNVRDADIAIMVVPPGFKRLKPSAKEILSKIDLFIINKHHGHGEELIEDTRSQLISLRPRLPIVVLDPKNPFASGGLAQEDLLKRVQEAIGPIQRLITDYKFVICNL